MASRRIIDSIKVVQPRSAAGEADFDKYLDRLLTECYELPGVVVETEIDVLPGEAEEYVGVVSGEPSPELAEELQALCKTVLTKMSKKK